ncbi:MAG TPA: hypothetical protein PLC52_09565 [Anaerolineales bacterium]|nr:hypothetical protein [Anaerolineales bacterium]HRQ93097.1 hypothetical protein [Anaerolineales bacterium]
MKTAPLLLLTALLFAACAAPAVSPTQVAEAPPPTVAAAAPTESPTEATPTFAATTFVDAQGRFSFKYPDSWVVLGGEAGSRGDYVQIASWEPDGAELENLPRGESLLQVTVYQWDPKGDLAARVEMRRTALNTSGIQIAEEETVSFADGPDAVRMRLVQNGEETLVYYFVLGDAYLELSGQGDLQLLDQVMRSFSYNAK